MPKLEACDEPGSLERLVGIAVVALYSSGAETAGVTGTACEP